MTACHFRSAAVLDAESSAAGESLLEIVLMDGLTAGAFPSAVAVTAGIVARAGRSGTGASHLITAFEKLNAVGIN